MMDIWNNKFYNAYEVIDDILLVIIRVYFEKKKFKFFFINFYESLILLSSFFYIYLFIQNINNKIQLITTRRWKIFPLKRSYLFWSFNYFVLMQIDVKQSCFSEHFPKKQKNSFRNWASVPKGQVPIHLSICGTISSVHM